VLAQNQVFGNALGWDEHKMLVNHANAGPDGVAGGVEIGRTAVNIYFPRLLFIQAVEDVHQRRFTGPIFAKKGMDFTGTDLKIDLIIGNDTGESLDDSFHFNG
jgi:hypothetical protein